MLSKLYNIIKSPLSGPIKESSQEFVEDSIKELRQESQFEGKTFILEEAQTNLEIIKERHVEIQEIEHKARILSEIVKDLNRLIEDQEDSINDINRNITKASYDCNHTLKVLK
jgi:t-SNARE complex subunit (syntaxin)